MSAYGAVHSRRDVLSLPERVAEPIFSLIATSLLLAYFAYHQYAATGFFTAQFGPLEMLCLYGPLMLAPAAAFVRAVSGQRNPARPVEACTNLCMALAAVWLLMVFPFDFTHLADALPTTLQFMLAWVTNDIGKLILLLQVVVGMLVALLTLLRFLLVLGRR
jgi:hypothetical protein